jgi:RND family efflux transporter MFP subunit
VERERQEGLEALRIDEEKRGDAGGSRRRLWAALALALLLVVVAAVYFASHKPVPVATALAQAPAAGNGVAVLNASGYVTPRRRATVAAKITGRVTEVLVDEGMAVKEGQVLAYLDDSDAQRQLAVAKAEKNVAEAALEDLQVRLKNARTEMARAMSLQADGIDSVQTLDNARTDAQSLEAQLAVAREQVRSAEAQVEVYRQDLENYTIRAPFDGIAVSKDAQPGEMVSPISAGGGFTRTGISTIVDMRSLEIEVDVNEAYIAKVAPGQRVDAVLDAYPDWHMPARVRTVIPTADRQKATVKVRISFEKLDPRILPDMGVKVTFLGAAEPLPRGPRVLVPTAAVRQEAGKPVVFLVTDEHVEQRAVRVGGQEGDQTEILAGVSEGEVVVVAGPPDLHDGQRVRIEK